MKDIISITWFAYEIWLILHLIENLHSLRFILIIIWKFCSCSFETTNYYHILEDKASVFIKQPLWCVNFFLPSIFINLHWVNVWCYFYIFQRSKFVRKPLGGSNRATSTTIIQDSEFRSNMAHLMDTEAERNRLLARNGYGSDWRSDSTTPSSLQKRTLSAHGQRKEGRCPIITD